MANRPFRVNVLSGIEAWVDDIAIALGGPTQRRILATLALRRNDVVSVDQLAEITWPDGRFPRRYEHNIRTYVHRLRAALGDDAMRIETVGDGYRLNLDDKELDIDRFDMIANEISAITTSSSPERIVTLLGEVDRLWAARPFGEFAGEAWTATELARLNGTRVDLEERRAAALIELGRCGEAVLVLEALIDQQPLREEPRTLLMRALAGAGRRAESLRIYPDFRAFLLEETGVEPTSRMVELDRGLATGDVLPSGQLGVPEGYQILECLRTTATGALYRAKQTSLDRDVAIRTLLSAPANKPEFVQRFDAEARRIAQIDHPAAVPLYDYWRGPGEACLVEKWMPGGSLASRMATTESIERDQVIDIIRRAGDVIGALHSAALSHGAVDMRSIFLDVDGAPHLGRFLDGKANSDDAGARTADALALCRLAQDLTGLLTDWDGSLTITSIASTIDRRDRQLEPDVVEVADDLIRAVANGRSLLRHLDRSQPNPYKGLDHFDDADAAKFYGRSHLVDQLIESVPEHPIVVLVGPSGAGKSSVVQAGLVPAIRAGRIEDTQRWYTTAMRPSHRPLLELESALRRVAVRPVGALPSTLATNDVTLAAAIQRCLPEPGATLLLIVDQLEELFLDTVGSEQRAAFLDAITSAAADPANPLQVIATLRADFIDRALHEPVLAQWLERGTIMTPPLSAAELEQAIVEPAMQAGVAIDPALVTILVADCGNQAGSLPHLQYTLTELFERRQGPSITLDDYRQLGGLAATIADRADRTYNALPVVAQGRAPDVFGRLVVVGDGVPDTRRRVLRSEFGDDPTSADILDRFGQSRLLAFDHHPVTRQPTVELAHETVLTEWARLASWVDADRHDLTLRRRLTESAEQWASAGQDRSDLYGGHRLEAALEWQARSKPVLNDVEDAFVAASIHEQARFEAEANRRHRRMRLALASVAALLVVALIAGALAIAQGIRARQQASVAEAAGFDSDTRRLTALAASTVEFDRVVGLLLAAEAYRREPSAETLGGLQRVLTRTGPFLGLLGGGQDYHSIVWSPDGTTVFAADVNGVDALDVASGSARRIYDGNVGNEIAVSPEGGLLAIPDLDGQLTVIDTDNGLTVWSMTNPSQVTTIAFTPDGSNVGTGDRAGMVRLFDAADGSTVDAVLGFPEQSQDDLSPEARIPEGARHENRTFPVGVRQVRFTPDGDAIVATGGFSLRRFRTSDLSLGFDRSLQRPQVTTDDPFPGRGGDIDFLDDGSTIVVAVGQVAQRFDVATGRLLGQFSPAPEVGSLPDDFDLAVADASILTVVETGEVRWHDPETGETSGEPLSSGLAGVFAFGQDLAVSPDQSELAVGAEGGVVVMSLEGSGLISRSVPVPAWGNRAHVSADGSRLMVSSLNRPPVLLDLDDPDARPLTTPVSNAYSGHLNQYGPMVLWENLDEGLTRGWFADPLTNELTDLSIGPIVALSGAVSPDQRLLAVGQGNPLEASVVVFDRATNEPVTPVMKPSEIALTVSYLAWSPDQERLVATTPEDGAYVYDTNTWTLEGPRIDQDGELGAVAFTPDGQFLLTAEISGRVIVRDGTTYQPTGVELSLGRSGIGSDGGSALTFTPDGRYLISTLDQPQIIDLTDWSEVGGPIPSRSGVRLTPSPDGRFVPTINDGRATVWELEPASWFDIACRAAGRNLTEVEWRQFGPIDDPPPHTCEGWDRP